MTYRKPAQQNKTNHSIPLVMPAVSAFIPLIRTQDVQGWMNRKNLHVTKVMPTGAREPFAYVKYVELGSRLVLEGLNCVGRGGEVADGWKVKRTGLEVVWKENSLNQKISLWLWDQLNINTRNGRQVTIGDGQESEETLR